MSRILWIDARLGALDAQDIERAKAAETMASADDGRERDLYEPPSMLTRAAHGRSLELYTVTTQEGGRQHAG